MLTRVIRNRIVAGAICVGVAVCALVASCERKSARLVTTELVEPGANTTTAEYQNGSVRVLSRVLYLYNLPTNDHSHHGDFAEVFRAMTGKELAEPATVRSITALLATLEDEGVKLVEEPGPTTRGYSRSEPRTRVFRVRR